MLGIFWLGSSPLCFFFYRAHFRQVFIPARWFSAWYGFSTGGGSVGFWRGFSSRGWAAGVSPVRKALKKSLLGSSSTLPLAKPSSTSVNKRISERKSVLQQLLFWELPFVLEGLG